MDKQPWLKAAVAKHPALLDEFFWKDGMVRVSGREFNGLIESPCHQHGVPGKMLSCLSCHSMHQSDPADQLARGMEGNQSCLQCHEKLRADVTAHTHHAADSSGSLCYNCHMPHTTYGVLKAIRSHQVSSPAVKDELATGRPNACNLCHLDKPLSWTARQLNGWFKQPVPSLASEQADTAAGVLWTLKGDAGLRALTAWHFGWEPAKQAGGTNWIAPFLGQLLDDRYSAVRIIAARSLRHLEGYNATVFDPITPPESRAPIQGMLLERWLEGRESAAAAPALLAPVGGGLDTNRFVKLLEQRDNRVVRLRE
jgi:predicted CXXCH cytochrome family protein